MHNSTIFNKAIYRLHRDRSASSNRIYALHQAVNQDMAERLDICKIASPCHVLEYGSRNHSITSLIQSPIEIERLCHADISTKILHNIQASDAIKIQCDDEALPLHENYFDLAISNLHLHWSNNPLLTLQQFYKTLKPDGIILLSLLGENTLKTLRECFIEIEHELGITKYHLSPMIRSESIEELMKRTGFKDIVADHYTYKVLYKSFEEMLHSIQHMGESNCLDQKISYLNRTTLAKAAQYYLANYRDHATGQIFCNFTIINAIGYK